MSEHDNALNWRRNHVSNNADGHRVVVTSARTEGVVIFREQIWKLPGAVCADPETEHFRQTRPGASVPADERVVLLSERYWTTDRDRASSSWLFALQRHQEALSEPTREVSHDHSA